MKHQVLRYSTLVAHAFRRERNGDADRCVGRIIQGYGSGEIIQYEVLCADGRRIMANEDAIRTR